MGYGQTTLTVVLSYLQQKHTTFSLQKTEICSKENDITLLFSSIKNKSQVDVVARRGAHLAAERSEEERSGAKRRGRGLGQRNIKIKKSLPQIKTWPTTICFIFFLWLHCLAVKNRF